MIPLNLDRAWWPGFVPRNWQTPALQAVAGSTGNPLVHAVMGAGKSKEIVGLTRAALAAGATRVVVSAPTEALVEQLSQDLIQYVGARNVGLFYGRQKDPQRPVMVTCFPSVQTYVENRGEGCDLWIVDEAHLSESNALIAAFELLKPTCRVGFSATPFRADKKSLSLFDSLAYSYPMGQAIADGVLVPWETIHPETGGDLDDVCVEMLRSHNPAGCGIIGAKSIEDAELFAERLCSEWKPVLPIHSGLSTKEKDHALSALKAGKVKALVHVEMLTTGVDIPWLSWLLLRRKYSSATAFLQFFGRGLRASEGKKVCTILDPWQQLESFSLEYAAQLGGEIELEPEKVVTPQDEQDFDLIDLPPFRPKEKIPQPTAKRAVSAWARAVLHAAQAAQVVQPSEWDSDGSWRKKRASEKQVNSLTKMKWFTRHLPAGHIRDGVKQVIEAPQHLTSGAASDLQSVLSASATGGATAREQRRHWEWSSPIAVPAIPKRVLEGLKEAEKQELKEDTKQPKSNLPLGYSRFGAWLDVD